MSTNRYPLRLIIVGLLMTLASLGLYSTLVQAVDNPASVDSPGETLAPEISLVKTVGSDPNVCATSDNITVAPGSQVTYCYEVTNTGDVALGLHTLQDSQLGTILNDFPYTLVPGASAFLTQTHTITETTLNTATWTAYNPGPTDIITATASATVEVLQPGISLSKTVGTDPNVCAATDNLAVPPGSQVTYCYEVTNTGGVALGLHTLQDNQLGTILNDFAYSLVPGASVFLTQTHTITATTLNTATWTAYNPGPVDETSAEAQAMVIVTGPGLDLYLPLISR